MNITESILILLFNRMKEEQAKSLLEGHGASEIIVNENKIIVNKDDSLNNQGENNTQRNLLNNESVNDNLNL